MVDHACTSCIHHRLASVSAGRGKPRLLRHACLDPESIAAVGGAGFKSKLYPGVSCDDARRMNDITVCGPRGLHWMPVEPAVSDVSNTTVSKTQKKTSSERRNRG